MKIAKFVDYKQRDVLKSIAAINQVVLDTDKEIKLDKLFGLIENSDTSYQINSLEDVVFAIKNAKGIHHVFLNFDYKYSDEERRYAHPIMELKINRDTFLSVDIGLPETQQILQVFDRLKKEIFKKEYYKYNKKSENSSHSKIVREKVISIYENFDELQVRSLKEIRNEKDFQDFSYAVLRSHFSDLEDEHYLPKYGTKTYKPDFGVPSAKLLIELKHVKSLSDLKKRQSEIHDDVIGYLSSSDRYKNMIVAIYNQNNIAINGTELRKLEKLGIRKIIICNHVTPNNI